MTDTTIPITANNIPSGALWESDGSCWRAGIDSENPKGWRWFPMNFIAYDKGEPTAEMTDSPIAACTCPQLVGRDSAVLDVTREPCQLHPSRYL